MIPTILPISGGGVPCAMRACAPANHLSIPTAVTRESLCLPPFPAAAAVRSFVVWLCNEALDCDGWTGAGAHRRTVGDKHHSADLSNITEISEVDYLPEVFVNELEASRLRKEWKI